MVTVSAAAAEATVCIVAVGVGTASAVVYHTFVDIYTVQYHHERINFCRILVAQLHWFDLR